MKDTALVFDLDGTLIDSLPDLHAAVNEMLGELHRPELTPAQVRPMIGDGSRALVERALAATGPASDLDAAYDRFLPIYEAQSSRLSYLPRPQDPHQQASRRGRDNNRSADRNRRAGERNQWQYQRQQPGKASDESLTFEHAAVANQTLA
jgi:FMN phosphatase YigB (HAD superfamily)